MNKTLSLIAGLCAFATAVFAQTPVNNLKPTYAAVPTNTAGALIYTGAGEVYLDLYNAGTNTVLWTGGTTLATTTSVSGTVTSTYTIAESLAPAATKVFDKNIFNSSDLITARTTNGQPGAVIIHKGY